MKLTGGKPAHYTLAAPAMPPHYMGRGGFA